ncbi:YaiI/YqxD family protein [Haloplasma contractile]|uniref:UPF0178 protein HLPCO_002019 n=1 Tax=Haloplasma contractile SSD-17B TaxID=1033810 RepID=U2FGX6_9MOLU|nr:YaiI/YqxD family protein [Haloplasma contractile]ERJ12105.1 putative BCR protein [Haloplasma contractile SSD-17B]
MKLLVDADACPVKEQIVKIAKEFQLEVVMFIDTSHIYHDGYSKVITIDKGRDQVDFALINYLNENDIVISQDYGVACMALSKHAFVLNQNGLIYTNENIDGLLQTRYVNQKMRNAGLRTKGPKKRSHEQDIKFEKSLVTIINNFKLQ